MIIPTSITPKILKKRDEFLDQFKDRPPKEIFELSKEDPAIFAYYMLGIKLYGWQWLITRDIVKGERKFIFNTSRQIGKSFLVGILSLWYQMFNLGKSSKYENTKVGIVSASDGQAKKLLLDVKNLMRIGDSQCKEAYDIPHLFTRMIDLTQGAENTKTCVTFIPWEEKLGPFLKGSKIGGFIKTFPPTDSIRGETLDFIIVDEASIVDDEIYNSAISKTGDFFEAIRFLTSTPRGRSGFYYEYFDPEEKLSRNTWKRYWFTVDAIKHDEPRSYAQRKEDIAFQLEAGKNLTVRQEYYGDFVQAESSYFNPKMCDHMIEDYEPVDKFPGMCDLGVDFGGLRKSRSVLTIVAYDDELKAVKRLWHTTYEVKEDALILLDIAELMTKFNIQRVVVDDCPEGDYKIREMEDKGWDVTRFKFGSEKALKFGHFRSKLNKGEIKSYHDSELLIEMKALTQAKGTRNTKIQPPPGYSDDSIDSFVIASYHYTQNDDDFNFYDLEEVKPYVRKRRF